MGIGPNPQSPIPNPQSPIPIKFGIYFKLNNYILNKKISKIQKLIKNKKYTINYYCLFVFV